MFREVVVVDGREIRRDGGMGKGKKYNVEKTIPLRAPVIRMHPPKYACKTKPIDLF